MTHKLDPISRTSAADAVAARLSELIADGSLPVGQRLPAENELARSFGVSRPVVREALGMLRAMGLVASRSGSGSSVAARRATGFGVLLGEYSSEDLYESRALVEVPGAGIAALRRTDDHVRELAEIVERQFECAEPDQWVELDLRFHGVIAEATGNDVLGLLIQTLSELQLEQSRAIARTARLTRAAEEHQRILEGIRSSDEAAARDAMAGHLHAIRIASVSEE